MNSSVRINVRVLMGNAIGQFNKLISQIHLLESAAAKSSKSATGFGQRWTHAFSSLTLAGKRLSQTGRILTYNFTLPLVLAFTALERQALKVNTAMAQLRQVYTTAAGASSQFGQVNAQIESDLQNLSKAALIMSNSFGVAQADVLGLMGTFARAGQAGVQVAQSTELALTMMQAFGMSAQDASDAILTVATNYQLTGEETRVAVAALGYAAQQTRADVESLSAGFVKSAPAAQQLGIDVVHLSAMLATLQQAGFKGAESGTALNFMMTRLVKATPEAAKLMQHLGLDVDKAAYAAASGTTRFNMITDALAGLTSVQRQYAVAVIFGARQQPKATALIADALRKGGMYNKLLGQMTDSTQLLAYMDNQLITSMDNASTKFQILKTNLVNNLMVIANMLTPALLALTNMLVEASTWFAKLGDTASGRQMQAFIILGAVALAAVGPLAVLIGSIMTLVGFLGSLGSAAIVAATALASPWGIVAAALAALLVFSASFRNAFINVFIGLYNALIRIAMMIYEALQWMNPFARHSPSLVEQTRDGVAAMIGYWQGARPILGVMDATSAAVRRFGAAMAGFNKTMQDAQNAQDRANIGKVAGPAAVAAFDNLVAANARLAAQLPLIAHQYDIQARAVDRAKTAMDAANASVQQAQKDLDALNKQQTALQKQRDAMGDPKALRSQAEALSGVARGLESAGNNNLAGQFQSQADALGASASQADAVQQQLDTLANQIDAQSAALDNLKATYDGLSTTYDNQNAALSALKDGYDAVTQAIQNNQQAMSEAGSNAKQHIDALKAAADSAKAAKKAKGAKKGKGAGGAGGAGGFAGFDAAGMGGGLPSMTGKNAIPKNFKPTGADSDWNKYLSELQQRSAKRLQALFPNPFAMVGQWLSKLRSAWHSVEAFFTGAGKGGIHMDLDPAMQKRITDFRNTVVRDFDQIKSNVTDVANGLRQAWDNFVKHFGPTFIAFAAQVRSSLQVVIKIVMDLVRIIASRLMKMFAVLADFWKTNGPAIGTIVGVIATFFVDWWRILLKMVTWVVKVLWPVLRTGIDGLLQVAQGILQIVGGIIGFIVNVLTGRWKKAWHNLVTIFKGIGNVLWGAVKALGAALLLAFVVVVAAIGDAVIAGILGFGPMVGRAAELAFQFIERVMPRVGPGIVRGIAALGKIVVDAIRTWVPWLGREFYDLAKKFPGWMWQGFKDYWEGVWLISKFVGGKITTWLPDLGGLLGRLGGHMPGWMWDGMKGSWDGIWSFSKFMGGKIANMASAVSDKFVHFGTKMPIWLWHGFKASFTGSFDFGNWIASHLPGWAATLSRKFADFAGKIPGWLWNGLKNVSRDAWHLAQWITEALTSAGRSVVGDLANLGRDIINGIIQGIKSIPGALAGAVTGALSDALSAGKHWLISHSPSKRARDMLGRPISQGIAVGITDQAHVAERALTDVAQRLAMTSFQNVSLPTLIQNVRLNYLNAPLTALATTGQPLGLPSAQNGAAAGTAPAGTTVNMNVDMTKHESSDPMAAAAIIGWSLRTGVS